MVFQPERSEEGGRLSASECHLETGFRGAHSGRDGFPGSEFRTSRQRLSRGHIEIDDIDVPGLAAFRAF